MSARDEVLQRLRVLLGEQLGRDGATIAAQATFAELGLDSVAAVELVARVEEDFDVVVAEEDAVHLTNVDALARHIARQRS